MKNVTYINAGAGSGKTYTLTSELTRLVSKEQIRPEQVIMTTFTILAASEFKARAKARLYEAGLHEAAARLDQALIGTIHSVFQHLIGKYWYYLGLPPEMGVMDDDTRDFYISQSLATLPSPAELEKLHGFIRFFGIAGDARKGETLNYNLWRDQLVRIINGAINYEIDDFEQSRQESLAFIKQFVQPGARLSAFESILGNNLKGMLAEARESVKGQKTASEKLDKFDYLEKKEKDKDIKWYKYLKEEFKVKRRCPSYQPLCEALIALPLWTTEDVYERQAEYINLLFDLAQRWREDFLAFKRANNLLDFNDMEHYMLELLKNPTVAEEIGQSYRYLFVDEFQDCSPMQVKIFDCLSDHMKESYWVGDYKQAIYGFRGSDTKLTKVVVDRVKRKESIKQDNCHTRVLPKCYRSQPDIVNLNNVIFETAFQETLDKENIHLDAHREKDGTRSLRYFCVSEEADVAAHVAHLVKTDGVAPKDIGILGRTKYELDPLAAQLADYGVKVDRANLDVASTATWQLVSALLRIVASGEDNLAKAQVAMLTDDDFTTAGLIERKLLFDQQEGSKRDCFLQEEPFVRQVLTLRPELQQQSVASLVESLIIELRLGDVAIRVQGDASRTASCLQAIQKAAEAYENYCVQMSLPATIYGFISYVETMDVKCGSDPEGVHVCTYHGSKGLEWPYVILLSLNNDIDNQKRIIHDDVFDVHCVYTEQPSEECPYPNVIIRVAPFIYGCSNTPVPEPMLSQLVGSQLYQEVRFSHIEEAKRLLYVGMTRPRDVLMLAVEGGQKKGFFSWFKASGIQDIGVPLTGAWAPFGDDFALADYSLSADEAAMVKGTTILPQFYELNLPAPSFEKRPLRYISPSGMSGIGKAVSFHNFEKRISLVGQPDMSEVGNCIHQIFAGIEHDVDLDFVVRQYGLHAALPHPAEIRTAWQQLHDYLTTTFGQGTTYHERPFRLERDGQTVIGSIDLVWQTAEGDILIDFKTFPGRVKEVFDELSPHFVGRYAGQLSAYKEALEAASEHVLKCFIYYPVGGLLVEVKE